MTGSSAIAWSWTAVHLFTVFVSFFLWFRVRRIEYGVYGGMGLALALLCGSTAYIAEASSPAEAMPAQVTFSIGAGLVLAAAVLFAHLSLKRLSPRAVTVVMVFMVAAQPLALTAIIFDPDVVTMGANGHVEAGFSPFGKAIAVFACALAMWIVVLVWPREGDPRSGRVIRLAFLLIAVGWIVDVAFTMTGRSSAFTENFASASGLAISYLLLTEIGAIASKLSARTTQLRYSYDELRHVQEELVQKEQLAAVGELSAVIADEVANPIRKMKAAASALQTGEDDESLDVLDEEAERLNRLVRDLLHYARPMELQVSAVSLPDLMSALTPESVESVEIEVAVDGHVQGDRSLLEQVFRNILTNAIDAMPEGGVLTIATENVKLGSSDAIAIRVRDTGEGMDTLVRSRAIDPFFTTRAGGTGLGLAIVQRIVRAHGGSMELRSVEPGSEVTITLPASVGA